MNFATCSYYEARDHMGIPVRTSNGAPRFRLNYRLDHALPFLAPDRKIMELPTEAFTERYLAQLDRIGLDHLLTKAAEIQHRAGRDERLVLLCFERWNHPKRTPEHCHRHVLADWLGEHGYTVPELGVHPTRNPQQPEQDAQQPLFT